MHITITFIKGFYAVTVNRWLKTHFYAAQPALLAGKKQVWKVSGEHTVEHVEENILDTWPVEWPVTGAWVSDRKGNRV